mgnify:CR=1 FL=1
MEKVWIGYVPTKDDFDDIIIDEFIDGKTRMGPWAIMSPSNFSLYGAGLGTGLGQRYKKQDNGNWLKVEG